MADVEKDHHRDGNAVNGNRTGYDLHHGKSYEGSSTIQSLMASRSSRRGHRLAKTANCGFSVDFTRVVREDLFVAKESGLEQYSINFR